ncbi:MBL fold metallo-hydrolase [Anaerobacillus isosaccharinicus]|uniref:Metallo-beta-lactamase domain-containing protein n=2 Tax=Anaerobacillus isosaccharinicus TaxID=1532552 RepID=A0A1S2MG26_9BACI|nr:MBL fold metallo-hydrolase [Anaerobacillus isosaccharinicus]
MILTSVFLLNQRRKTLLMTIFLCVALVGCNSQPNEVEEVKVETKETTNDAEQDQETPKSENETKQAIDPIVEPINGAAEIHFIDVGQGDATLLVGPNFTVLIDAGRHDRNDVVPYLKSVGVWEIDLLVGTHPHADHIGQMDKVLEAFPVKEVWMSGDPHTSRTFEHVLNAILDHDVDYYEPRAGEQFEIGSLLLKIVNPVKLSGDFHEGSIGLVATFGEVSILFTGDAEKQTEEAMLARKEPVQAQIFQLGHHGSSTSNIEKFLNAVSPEVTIYSAGADNSYGHPHREVIDRLGKMNIPVYGTVENGTIVITTDGSSYAVLASEVTNGKEEQAKKEVEKLPSPPVGTCIDVNTASLQELQRITHVGEERARQLVELRPFHNIDELTRINGIGAGRLKDIKAEGLACVN